jgi:ParB family chromosome partitioning protein
MLTTIQLSRIHPHPNNPRQSLGDLTELAASIQQSGILQNLTIVPKDPARYKTLIESKRAYKDDYIVIIGHRRLAAARQAGLDTVPCTIVCMDEKAQLSAMLVENMTRTDLTLAEQAHGIQLMLDMGETIATVSAKTGFSESTVRNRVKLAALDKQALIEAESRGGRLDDYLQLDKIKDPALKTNVLKAIGTTDFNWKLTSAISTEQSRADFKRLLAHLENETDIKRIKSVKQYEYVKCIHRIEGLKIKKKNESKYFYLQEVAAVYLYKAKAASASQDTAADQAKQSEQERVQQLKDLSRHAYDLRRHFVQGFTPTKDTADKVMSFAIKSMLNVSWSRIDPELHPEITQAAQTSPQRALLLAAYNYDMDNSYWVFPSQQLTTLYDALIPLGYPVSTEEQALLDGTHTLYAKG